MKLREPNDARRRYNDIIQEKCNMGRILSFEWTGLKLRVHQHWIPYFFMVFHSDLDS